MTPTLEEVIATMENFLSEESPARRLPVGWRAGDEICDQTGDTILASFSKKETAAHDRSGTDLYIATQLYAGGGHTAVIGDFIRACDAEKSILAVTNTVERDIYTESLIPREVIERVGISYSSLKICPETQTLESTRWLMELILEIRPRRIFLFHHPQDAVAIAGARASLCEELYLVHHADRKPTLGMFQAGTRIIDLSPFTATFTSRILGLENIYVPLVVNDPGMPPYRKTGRPFTTACSGSHHKFGDFYPDNIIRILKETQGRHIHIGFLKAKRLEKIRSLLEEHHIPASQFEYIEWVPSLATALIDLKVDISIGSAPMGGARTSIEACAAGVPHFPHLPPFSTHFGASHVIPEGLPVWRTISELTEALQRIDEEWLAKTSLKVRRHYEEKHHPSVLQKALSGFSPFPPVECPVSELIDLEEADEGLHGDFAPLRESFAPGLLPQPSKAPS